MAWGYAAEFMKDTIELGKTIKSAGSGYFCNFSVPIEQHLLCVSDSGHLDIGCNRKAGNGFKLMRQVVSTDKKFSCKAF